MINRHKKQKVRPRGVRVSPSLSLPTQGASTSELTQRIDSTLKLLQGKITSRSLKTQLQHLSNQLQQFNLLLAQKKDTPKSKLADKTTTNTQFGEELTQFSVLAKEIDNSWFGQPRETPSHARETLRDTQVHTPSIPSAPSTSKQVSVPSSSLDAWRMHGLASRGLISHKAAASLHEKAAIDLHRSGHTARAKEHEEAAKELRATQNTWSEEAREKSIEVRKAHTHPDLDMSMEAMHSGTGEPIGTRAKEPVDSTKRRADAILPIKDPYSAIWSLYQSSKGRLRNAFESAFHNAGLYDPETHTTYPSKWPSTNQLAETLVGAWRELHSLGNKPEEIIPIEKALHLLGVEKIGVQGDTEPFHGDKHQSEKGMLTGAAAKIIRPGWQMKEKSGTIYRLLPAQVEKTTLNAFLHPSQTSPEIAHQKSLEAQEASRRVGESYGHTLAKKASLASGAVEHGEAGGLHLAAAKEHENSSQKWKEMSETCNQLGCLKQAKEHLHLSKLDAVAAKAHREAADHHLTIYDPPSKEAVARYSGTSTSNTWSEQARKASIESRKAREYGMHKQAIHQQIDKIKAGLPTEIQKTIGRNLKGVQVHESTEELTKHLLGLYPDKKIESAHRLASYDRKSGTLHTTKGVPESVLAHELGHVLDGPTESISSSPEMMSAARKHGAALSDYATTHSSEALAELMRVRHEEGPETARKKALGMVKALHVLGYREW